MKRILLIVVVILVVLLALPFVKFIGWSFQQKKPMNVILVDKTVPTLERLNHKSFNWVLTNERFVKKGSNSGYSYKKDYYGFIPTRPLREFGWTKNEYRLTDLKELPAGNDAVYFTDTYGVFSNDWYKGLNRSRRSRMIYGGLNNTDNLLIKEMKDNKKLVLLEYNVMDHPTTAYESFRLQERLGVSLSGWSGRYFSSLDSTDKEFPIWLTSMYRKSAKKPWHFSKAGIVLLTSRDVIVLEEGTHLSNPMPSIVTDEENSSKYGLVSQVAFNKWFEILDARENTVISKFKIETTAEGDTLLNQNNLSSSFPSVIKDPAEGLTYYFAGDFSNNDVPMWTARLKNVSSMKLFLYSDKSDDARRFFWLYYRPLISSIFNEHYAVTSAK
ncbi:MAG: hypothetical protein MUE32_07435 [Bacteroidales bacterium]|nr:hypothetical protein [Bacteroidales bacterium]